MKRIVVKTDEEARAHLWDDKPPPREEPSDENKALAEELRRMGVTIRVGDSHYRTPDKIVVMRREKR
jgi:hypothetical protein